MSAKLDRMRRLLAVQRQRDHLSKWRLAKLLAQSASLDERYQTLKRFLHQEPAFSGLYLVTLLRKSKTLEELRAQAAIDEEKLRIAHLQDRRCLRHVERMIDALQSGEKHILTVRELEETVVARRPAAAARFPQATGVNILEKHKCHKSI